MWALRRSRGRVPLLSHGRRPLPTACSRSAGPDGVQLGARRLRGVHSRLLRRFALTALRRPSQASRRKAEISSALASPCRFEPRQQRRSVMSSPSADDGAVRRLGHVLVFALVRFRASRTRARIPPGPREVALAMKSASSCGSGLIVVFARRWFDRTAARPGDAGARIRVIGDSRMELHYPAADGRFGETS